MYSPLQKLKHSPLAFEEVVFDLVIGEREIGRKSCLKITMATVFPGQPGATTDWQRVQKPRYSCNFQLPVTCTELSNFITSTRSPFLSFSFSLTLFLKFILVFAMKYALPKSAWMYWGWAASGMQGSKLRFGTSPTPSLQIWWRHHNRGTCPVGKKENWRMSCNS